MIVIISKNDTDVHRKLSGYDLNHELAKVKYNADLMFIQTSSNEYECIKNRITGMLGVMSNEDLDVLQAEYFNRKDYNG